MTRDDIIRMARESGCGWAHNGTEPLLTGETQIERFAALVAANTKAFCPVCNQRDAVRAKFDEESG